MSEPVFLALVKQARLPSVTTELRFAPPRKWRFDYAWEEAKVALEVEGGVWSGGRHTRGAGFLKDMEKYNAATVLGWRVLRVTPSTLATMSTISLVKRAIESP
jgi:very-short-patch-repair endonuclease